MHSLILMNAAVINLHVCSPQPLIKVEREGNPDIEIYPLFVIASIYPWIVADVAVFKPMKWDIIL